MGKYSLSDIRTGYTTSKLDSDSGEFWLRYVVRPISFPVSLFFINMGISANQVTYLSLLLLISGLCMIASGQKLVALSGAILIVLWLVLDCVDGNIARIKGGSKYGEFIDAIGAYFAYAFLFLALGVYAFRVTPISQLQPEMLIILGAMNSIFATLAILIYNKHKLIVGTNLERSIIIRDKSRSLYSYVFLVGRNLGFMSGIINPLTPFALYFDLVPQVIMFYLPIYATVLVAVTIKSARQIVTSN